MEPAVIILNADLKSSLAAIRSLGRKQIYICAGAPRSSAMGVYSRYVSESFVYPDPRTDKASFSVTLKTMAKMLSDRSGQPPLVYCFSDATYLTALELLGSNEGLFLMPVARSEEIKIAFDKKKTADLATKLGINTIKTHNLAEAHGANYPLVIKPASSVAWHNERGYSGTAEFAFNFEALKSAYERIMNHTGIEPIIQDCLVGEEYGVELMCKDGEVIAEFAHVRLRSLSPSGGAAVVKQTAPVFHLTETMVEQSKKIARALNWTGPMMVEWKVEKRSDKLYLMEINGRFWGSLPLPIEAGVDFPWLYYQLATGKEAKMPEAFSPLSVRTRHFWGDVRWLSKVTFDRTKLRHSHYPSRLRALWTFLLEPFKSKGDIWSLKDPLPALMEVIDIIRR